MYNEMENYKKNCSISLLSPLCRYVQWCIQAISRCYAAARRSCNNRELNFHVMIPSFKMYKGCHYEAAACEVKRNNSSLPKAF